MSQIYIGSSWNMAFQFWDNTNNVAIDITGQTFEFDFQGGNLRELITTLTIGSGITVLSLADGVIQIALTSAQTKLMAPGPVIGALYRTDVDRQIMATFDATIELPATSYNYLPPYGYVPDYGNWGWP